ncbi:MAG: hypothetical protein LBD18_07580 [Treponema sp.]|jgi:hypothetical protein|nr:hypothetical protein [Treponema sp.]
MTKFRNMSLLTLAVFLLASCTDIFFTNQNKNAANNSDGVFYARNFVTNNDYELKADKLYEGKKSVVWAERGAGISAELAQSIANEYDNSIYQRVVDAFSMKNFTVDHINSQITFDNIMDLADWLTDGDGKLTILLLDIKDGFKKGVNNSYTAGYFSSANFYERGRLQNSQYYSNGRDMIYVDTNPGLASEREQAYATFAHELQHLINFVTTWVLDRDPMDTWIDEGLSSQAEYLYLQKNPADKLSWFKDDPAGTIAKGNNFFVWDNHQEEPDSIMDEYATVYLFFRWLYLQADNDLKQKLLYNIITSDYADYQAVTRVAKEINSNWASWEKLLGAWLAANYIADSNTYGYKDDPDLKTIKVKMLNVQGNRTPLYPGEGVYSSIVNFPYSPPANPGSNSIKYAGLSQTASYIYPNAPYSGDVLLTFNGNSDGTKSSETGYLTGAPGSPSPSGYRSLKGFSGPLVVDAWDIVGRRREPALEKPPIKLLNRVKN